MGDAGTGYVLKLSAVKVVDPEVKALAVSGSTLAATWTNTDVVSVYNSSSTLLGTLTVTPDGLDATQATLSGSLTTAPSAGDVLTLKYLSASYGLQDGTLTGRNTSIDKVCDYAVATVTVSSVNTASKTIAIVGNTATFVNQQAIVKFTLQDSGGSAISASEFVVQVGDNNYAVVPASASSELYVAIPGFTSTTVSLFAKVGTNWYSKERASEVFTNSQYYTVTVRMNQTGMLPGKFTVNNNGDQVRFSQGNLRATNNTANSTTGWIWSFAGQQYDYLGTNNAPVGNNVITEPGSVDLFGWVGEHASLAAYGINSTTNGAVDYGNTAGEALKDDWGNLAISNGGNTPSSGWRTLTNHYDDNFPLQQEWVHILKRRTTGITINETADARYTAATINTDATSVHGYILFPDNYAGGTPGGVTWGTINAYSSWTTTCTTAGWISLEAAGCVFLPAAGRRTNASTINYAGTSGIYWSSTSANKTSDYQKTYAQCMLFVNSAREHCWRYFGHAVRLVKDAN